MHGSDPSPVAEEPATATGKEPAPAGKRRPAHARPMPLWARVVGGVGRTLITLGVLILLFVAYQLWGTNLQESRAQSSLENQFEELVGTDGTTPTSAGSTTVPTVPPTTTPTGPTTDTTPLTGPPLPKVDDGEAMARISIPAIGVDKYVVQGVAVPHLKKGPGHYPETPLPGRPGNAAIAGHRTTYGAPFHRIDELNEGDRIVVTTLDRRTFTYEVRLQRDVPFDGIDPEQLDSPHAIVRPTQVEVAQLRLRAGKPLNTITLTSCNPKYSARQRIVVTGELVGTPVAPPPVTEQPDDGNGSPTTTIPGDDPATDTTGTDAFALESLNGDPTARGPAIGWGLICAGIWLAAWLLGRIWRRWPAYLIATPVFLVCLYTFFENFGRLLPTGY